MDGPELIEDLREQHSWTVRRLLAPYYSSEEALERAVEVAAEGTVEAFRRRANGVTDEAGQQRETVEAVCSVVREVPPDQPAETVEPRLRLRVEKFGRAVNARRS